MAVAWAKDNIQVNAVLPGWVDTDLTRNVRQQVPARLELAGGDFFKAVPADGDLYLLKFVLHTNPAFAASATTLGKSNSTPLASG
jgi:NAD(P)-dependent dehydrogenase (short-subunit alcohol dehydrogenase family)